MEPKPKEQKRIYIANDIECTGNTVGIHSVMSWGACVVTREKLTKEERLKEGLTFYAEFKPKSSRFEPEAVKIGCAGLSFVKVMKVTDLRFDPASKEFDPGLVVTGLYDLGEGVFEGVSRFMRWIKDIKETAGGDVRIVPVTDTVFLTPCS